MAGGDSPWGALWDEGFKPLLVSLQVGLIHLDRTWVVGQHLEERFPEDSHGLVAVRRAYQIDQLEWISSQIVERFGPHAIPKVMMARGHQGHPEPDVPAAAPRLWLELGCVDLL